MADIVTVREFFKRYRTSEPGQQFIVVDGCRKKVVTAIEVLEIPNQVEKDIKIIYTR
jgi:hypothetical protein